MRTWIYPDEPWWFYVELSRAPPDWEAQLAERAVDHLLLTEDFHGATLLPAALASSEWELVLQTDQGALFSSR